MSKAEGQPYRGAVGTTRKAETSVFCSCGTVYRGRYHTGVDATDAPTLLTRFLDVGYEATNAMKCPACGVVHVAIEPLLVHQPARERLYLVVPVEHRHRTQQIRAAALADIADNPGADVVPAYALDPQLVFGFDGLREAVRGRPRTPPPAPAEPEPAQAVRAPVPVPKASPMPVALGKPGKAPPLGRPGLTEPIPSPIPTAHAETPAPPEVEPEAPQPEEASVEIIAEPEPPAAVAPEAAEVEVEIEDPAPGDSAEDSDETREHPASARKGGLLAGLLRKRSESGPPVAPEVEDRWDAAVDDGWSLPSDEVVPGPDDDPTHVVRVDDVVAERRPAGPTFDQAAADGADRYVVVADGRVTAAVRVDAARATELEDSEVVLAFQLHAAEPTPVAGLLLGRLEDGEVVDHVFWPLDRERDAAVLDALAERFDVEVVFHVQDGFHGRRRLRAALEANVASARALLDEAGASASDRSTARSVVMEDGYDRVGRLRHNFHRESFTDLVSASDARLALGIQSYWSAPERRDYLLRVKSFPEVWYDGMTRRVLGAAIEFGLAMEPHMRQQALELGLAESSAALLRTTLANFAEVNLNLKSSGLDALDLWENWEALLAHAEELDMRVDEDIEELAARAMERAREAAHAPDPVEINADEESIDLEEVSELGELSDVDLVGLLDEPSRRIDAVLGLLHRGDQVYVPAIFDAIKSMTRDELLATVPAALAMGPSFEQAFIVALRSQRISLRLASALFLAEIRSERAATPVLALLPDAADDDWPALARAAARMGRRILQPAIRQVESQGDRGGRVAYTLALLGPDARGALSAARDQASDAAVKGCLADAIDRVGQVSFGDAADFAERLGEAFAAAGPDLVGPDFEEELESIDLGPSASTGSLETDVDLGGLDSK